MPNKVGDKSSLPDYSNPSSNSMPNDSLHTPSQPSQVSPKESQKKNQTNGYFGSLFSYLFGSDTTTGGTDKQDDSHSNVVWSCTVGTICWFFSKAYSLVEGAGSMLSMMASCFTQKNASRAAPSVSSTAKISQLLSKFGEKIRECEEKLKALEAGTPEVNAICEKLNKLKLKLEFYRDYEKAFTDLRQVSLESLNEVRETLDLITTEMKKNCDSLIEEQKAYEEKADVVLNIMGTSHIKRDWRRMNSSGFPAGDDLKELFEKPFLQFESYACDVITALGKIAAADKGMEVQHNEIDPLEARNRCIHEVMAPLYETCLEVARSRIEDKKKELKEAYPSMDIDRPESLGNMVCYEALQNRVMEDSKRIEALSREGKWEEMNKDPKIKKCLDNNPLIVQAYQKMLELKENGTISDTENDIDIPQMVYSLITLMEYAETSDPRCFIYPPPGQKVDYHPNYAQEVFSPGARIYGQIKERDKVTVVLPGLYFEEMTPDRMLKIKPVVKPCVARQMTQNSEIKPQTLKPSPEEKSEILQPDMQKTTQLKKLQEELQADVKDLTDQLEALLTIELPQDTGAFDADALDKVKTLKEGVDTYATNIPEQKIKADKARMRYSVLQQKLRKRHENNSGGVLVEVKKEFSSAVNTQYKGQEKVVLEFLYKQCKEWVLPAKSQLVEILDPINKKPLSKAGFMFWEDHMLDSFTQLDMEAMGKEFVSRNPEVERFMQANPNCQEILPKLLHALLGFAVKEEAPR